MNVPTCFVGDVTLEKCEEISLIHIFSHETHDTDTEEPAQTTIDIPTVNIEQAEQEIAS